MAYTRIVPLGGLGEVGMNCLALETPQGIVVIDCGVTFPHDEPGVDVIHPDFSYLWDRREEVLGVLVTHGHEDHIGALPYLLRRIPVPVWAPPYAAGLVRARLAEHAEVPLVDVRITRPRQAFDVGPFHVEPLRVTHSIPDAHALSITTPWSRIFHTGDFKLEIDPVDGEASDEARFRELGDEGVDVLLSDSTNVDVPGRAGRERDVAKNLRTLIERLPGRVIVGVFASNIYRVQALMDAAIATDRKICYLGRSVQNHARAASDLNRLRIPGDRLIPADLAMDLPANRLLCIASGTQAEPASAIARLARGDHPKLKLDRGDAVIFSSRAIPGNEREVFNLVCDLERRGVSVHFRGTDSDIHASGHAGREEQGQMIDLIRPRSFVPVHGTFHHLKRHADLAAEKGIRDIALIENGDTARWSGGALSKGDRVRAGRVYVDEGVELSDEVLAERNVMSDAGVVFATVRVNARGSLIETAEITTKGVAIEGSPDVAREAARVAIEDSLKAARGPQESLGREQVRESVRATLRRMYRVGGKRPAVIVQVTVEPGER